MRYIKYLSELKQTDIAIAGGKAANLGAMINAGLPVPGGFCITSNAYFSFVRANKIEEEIDRIANSPDIDKDVDKEDVSSLASLERASNKTRSLFLAGRIPEDVAGDIVSAYAKLENDTNSRYSPSGMTFSSLNHSGQNPTEQNPNLYVAVRSSATAEDLPDMSFAGQQDTYLNITGIDSLLDAVVNCWASLWNARAISYRNRISVLENYSIGSAGDITGGKANYNPEYSENIALAVVVQEMIQSEVSGVMFTANPLSGKRTETVIDATIGLGEALVSGQVEPDQYVCDNRSHRILSKTIGAKAVSIRSQSNGGTIKIAEDKSTSAKQVLDDKEIIELTKLGKKAVAYFQNPQDIEWAMAGNKIFLVQSRPITSLYPLPVQKNRAAGKSAVNAVDTVTVSKANANIEDSEYDTAYRETGDFKVWLSFGSWQGMLDPYTPIGRDIFKILAAGIGKKLGFITSSGQAMSSSRNLDRKQPVSSWRHFDKQTYDQNFFMEAGGRLYVNMTPLFKKPLGRKALPFLIEQIEPAILPQIKSLLNDPRLCPSESKKSLSKRFRMSVSLAPFFAPFIFNVIRNIKNPSKGRKRVNRIVDEMIDRIEKGFENATTINDGLALVKNNISDMPAYLLPKLVPIIPAGQAPLQMIRKLAAPLPDEKDKQEKRDFATELTRGLPFNVTTEMDLYLWKTAKEIKNDDASFDHFSTTDVSVLANEYLLGKLPAAAQSPLTSFMSGYGFRGIAEIDIGRTRWKEDPSYIMQMIKNYLTIEDPESSPEVVFKKGAAKAKTAADDLIKELKSSKQGSLKSMLAGFLIKRVRELVGMREFPKFSIMRIFSVQRDALLECGRQLTFAGVLEQPKDIFFLRLDEIEKLAKKIETTSGISPDSIESVQATIIERKHVYKKEMNRKRIPRMLLSDGEAFFGGITGNYQNSDLTENGESIIIGNPVSAGVIEGKARIVTDPFDAQLQHGEIMVCPATDPAWTPLFLSASGLIMEVGGMMTHGSVVAREYGIPAVVGVSQATSRLKTGQQIRLDGSNGKIYILS